MLVTYLLLTIPPSNGQVPRISVTRRVSIGAPVERVVTGPSKFIYAQAGGKVWRCSFDGEVRVSGNLRSGAQLVGTNSKGIPIQWSGPDLALVDSTGNESTGAIDRAYTVAGISGGNLLTISYPGVAILQSRDMPETIAARWPEGYTFCSACYSSRSRTIVVLANSSESQSQTCFVAKAGKKFVKVSNRSKLFLTGGLCADDSGNFYLTGTKEVAGPKNSEYATHLATLANRGIIDAGELKFIKHESYRTLWNGQWSLASFGLKGLLGFRDGGESLTLFRLQ